MKRSSLLQHLRRHGCNLKREGAAHSLWTNPTTGAVEAIPATLKSATTSRAKSVAASPSRRLARVDATLTHKAATTALLDFLGERLHWMIMISGGQRVLAPPD